MTRRKNRSLCVAGGTPLVEALASLGALKLRIEETGGSKPGRPEFEVWAPDGYSFAGAHSLVERDTEERIRMRTADMLRDLERCEPGCECGWDDPIVKTAKRKLAAVATALWSKKKKAVSKPALITERCPSCPPGGGPYSDGTHECMPDEMRCAYCGVRLAPYPCHGCGKFLNTRQMHEASAVGENWRCDECA